MKYLIYSYNYTHASAGYKVLHRLCHELNQAGQEAYIGFQKSNPVWNTPYHEPPLDGDWTAIYPEVISGNPWNAPRVVRYVLNNPGKLGGDKVYDPAEIVFVYSPLFDDMGVGPDRLLMLPTVETDIYRDYGLPRFTAMFYVGKGRKTRDLDAVEVSMELRLDRERLADALNHATVLYTFDNMTGMVDIARMCGCPVVMIPNGEYTRDQYDQFVDVEGLGWDEMPPPFDSAAFRDRYIASYDTFHEQLARFIEVTNGRNSPRRRAHMGTVNVMLANEGGHFRDDDFELLWPRGTDQRTSVFVSDDRAEWSPQLVAAVDAGTVLVADPPAKPRRRTKKTP